MWMNCLQTYKVQRCSLQLIWLMHTTSCLSMKIAETLQSLSYTMVISYSVGFPIALHRSPQPFRKWWLTSSKASQVSKIIWLTSLSMATHLLNMTRTSTPSSKNWEAGLVLNDNNCHFRKTSLHFLGHTITADEIPPDQGHIDAVLKAPSPSDVAALRPSIVVLKVFA